MKISRKQGIIIAIIAVVLIGGVGGFWFWYNQQVTHQAQQTKVKNTPQYATDQRQQLIDRVNKLYGVGNFEAAISLIEGQSNASDVELQTLLAGAYANSGDVKKAYEIYKKLDTLSKLPREELGNAANIATRAEEYGQAITWYEGAKDFSKNANPDNTDQLATYDYLMSELRKKQ